MLRRMRKAQSTAEYAIVIALVISAAVVMQIYIKRKLQGKVKDAVDYNESGAAVFGNSWLAAGQPTLKQYDPYYQTTDLTSSSGHREQVDTIAGGGVTRTVGVNDDISYRSGTTNILAAENAPVLP